MAVRQIIEGIYRIPLAWSNTYVLRERGDVMLIDCGLRKDRSALLAGLRELHVEPADVRMLLLTHGHCDHAGNAAFFAAQGTEVVAHADETRFLQLPRRSYAYQGASALRRPFTSLAFALGEILYPVERFQVGRVVQAGDTIAAPGGALRVVHSPGHAPGHIAFYREPDKILFSGDAILNIIPVQRMIGLSLPPRLLCDDWQQVHQSAWRLVELSPHLLLSGHGPPLTDNTAEAMEAWAKARLDPLLVSVRGKV